MKLKLKFDEALCYTPEFEINGIPANYNDFGSKYDRDPGGAEEYGCGDMYFERSEPKKDILEKYNITEEEYSEICDKLEEGLSFGRCDWCI